jgi:hypothetical protein
MLAVLSLAALLSEARPAIAAGVRTTCPSTPFEVFTPTARVCDALEVTGRIDDASVTLDPAFDTRATETELARPAPGSASLTGYNREGQAVFTFPFTANGAFRLVIPLAPQLSNSIVRLTLTANAATFERTANAGDAPSAEALASDDGHVIFIWNAQQYPGIRISNARDGSPILSTQGTESFDQIGVNTGAAKFIVSFSDGVHSVTRTVKVLGR